jgi:serine O-acetyltransferase
MTLEDIQRALLESYEKVGGINHFDGSNLPSQESVNRLASDFMHLLFPGFFELRPLAKRDVPEVTAARLKDVAARLTLEVERALRFAQDPDPNGRAAPAAMALLGKLPALRAIVHTDVTAAYRGDPAARNIDEIILAYPCVLAISLQRIAHELYLLKIPLIPRMLTEYAHERTGIDLHPGARFGTHFFIDHGTGVVIGETARIGDRVKIYQGVTLGAKSFDLDSEGNPVKGVKRHPDIEDDVTIYAHATILGGETRIGALSVIGANVSLLESIPPGSIAYNKGEHLVVRSRRKREELIEQLTADQVKAGDWVI